MEPIKYKQEIDQLLESVLREDWMDDEDWAEFKEMAMQQEGFSYKSLSKAIEVGIQKGFSLEEQIAITKKMLDGENEPNCGTKD